MAHKDIVAQSRANTLKAARSLIRLKHSIAADEELNETLPLIEAAFNAAVQRGQLPAVAELLDAYVTGDPK